MADRARLTIDLDALARNHAVLKAEARGAELAPVVKSDGYGLGVGPVSRRLWLEGARSFFVARLYEGQELRAALGPERPAVIHVLDGLVAGEERAFTTSGLTPVVVSPVALAVARDAGLPVTLHVDTGMNRQGMSLETALALDVDPREIGLIMSHLGSAADPDQARNARQLARFRTLRSHFAGVPASLAASAGLYLGPDYHFDQVRPGVSLYGGGPRETPDARFEAVATLTAPILEVREVQAGETIGYGGATVARTPIRLAIVAAGYTDGIIRAARGGGRVWVAGALRPLVLINMDLSAVDLGDADAKPGDEVELLGAHALLDDLAADAGTIAHEVLVRLSRRAERVYMGGA